MKRLGYKLQYDTSQLRNNEKYLHGLNGWTFSFTIVDSIQIRFLLLLMDRIDGEWMWKILCSYYNKFSLSIFSLHDIIMALKV